MDFRVVAVVISAAILSSSVLAKRVTPYCKKHHQPCTLKHGCISYNQNNARLLYHDGEYYNYEHKENFYNYISHNQYYAYVDNGKFYNYFKDGKYYSTCVKQQGYWQQGKWVVPEPVCK